MAIKISVNLPVKHLDKSTKFFSSLGNKVNLQFTDETAACIAISDDIYPMLLTHEEFREFTRKEIADATRTIEGLTCFSAENSECMNELVDTALREGATEAREPMDHGFTF